MKPYIKRVEIHNYKTHRNTRLSFSPNINSIVGPNGAGKSNIVEAILFALGERSPKNLRVSNFNEIVYNFKKDLDVSVTLTIVDSNGEEHKFKRIYSPKRSEHIYRYNGKRVSRTSYLLNLMKLGERGLKHVYIKQGDITKWAEATPRDLRDMVHEALGLKQYNQKRKEALEKLQEAERKLDNIQTQYKNIQKIVYEFRDHMIDFEIKEFLIHIKNNLEKTINYYEKERIQNRYKNIKSKIEAVTKKYERLRAGKNRLELRLESINSKLDKIREEKNQLNKNKNELTTKVINLIHEENKLREEIRSLKLHEINYQLNKLKEQIARERKIAKEEALVIRTYINDKKRLERLKRDLLKEKEKLTEKLESLEKERKQLIEEEIERINKLRMEMEIENEEIIRERILIARKEEMKKELEEISRRVKAYIKSIDKLKKKRDEINSEIKRLKKELDELRKKIRLEDKKLKKMRIEIKNSYKLLERLEKILSNIEMENKAEIKFYNDAAKVYDAAKTMKLKGVYGILSEMIKGPKDILALLKDLDIRGWHSIVVKDRDTALKLGDIAKELRKDIHIKTNDAVDIEIPENSVVYLIKYPKKIENVVLKEFGNIEVVSTLEEAIAVVERGGAAIHGDGDFLIYPGGYIRSKNIVLKIPRDIETLIKIRERFRKVIHKREELLAKEEHNYNSLIREENVIISKILKLKLSNDYLRNNIKLISDIVKRLQEKEKEIMRKLGKEPKKESDSRKDIEITRKSEELSHEISRLKREIEEIDNEILSINEEIAKVDGYLNSFKLVNERRIETIKELKKRISELQKEKPIRTEKIKEKARQMSELTRRRVKLINDINRIDRKLAKLDDKIIKAENIKSKLETKLRLVMDKIEETTRIRANLEAKRVILEQKLRTLIRTLGDIDQPPYRELKIDEAKKLLQKIEEELHELGDRSPIATKIYLEQLEPYKIYSQRRSELLNEREEIISFINEIDEKRREIFEEGYRKIRERFYEMFKEVFPDSRVTMTLSEEGNIDSEILVYVEFKGKPKILVSTASGGERTSVILMLLLSIYSINEDTIFLFDEVDAHMDLKVVDNISKIIKTQEKYSQIILVTLPGHDSMINIADTIILVSFTKNHSKTFPMKKELIEKVIEQ